MHEFPWFWVLFGMFFWLMFIRPRRLGACHGRWPGDEREYRSTYGGRRPSAHRRDRGHRGTAVADHDAVLAKLEERVRVLERIVTDDSARLRAEIDSLRDPPPSSHP